MLAGKLYHYIIDFFNYNECPSCGKSILEFPEILCPDCSITIDASFVFKTDTQLFNDRSVFWDAHIGMYPFEVIKRLVYAGKYGKRNTMMRISSEYFIRWISTMECNIDLISCVPMSIKKRIMKGQNHSMLIGRYISKKTGIPFRSVLKEEGRRTDQKTMSREMRFLNTIGRFTCNPDSINGKTVLLVDDVMTTGSTLNECSRVLKKSGVGKIIILTIATVKSKKLDKNVQIC